MNADWDDAPSRIRRKAGTAAVWGVSLAFGLCITGGGLYLAFGQMTTSAATHAQLSRFSADALRKPEAVHASQPANQQPYESPRIDEKNWIRPSDDAHRDAQAEL